MDLNTIDTSSAAQEITQAVETLTTTPFSTLMDDFLRGFVHLLPKLLTAAGILIIGVIAVRVLLRCMRALLKKSRLDPTLHHFLLSIINIVLYVVLATMVLAVLIPTAVTSLITLLGVFGLAVSLAVKDSLANLAGGISVLFTKPFALGDHVLIGSNEGVIKEIRLNYTVINTFDNKLIHIPNGDVAKAQITNFTAEPLRRLDLKFSIGYQDDFEKAERIILEALAEHPKALDDPPPVVRVVEHGSSAVILCCRVWCGTEDYWPLNFDLLEEVKRRFDRMGVSIPFDQLDVHVRMQEGADGGGQSKP